MKRVMLLVGIAISIGGTANAEYGFSSKDWSKLSQEIKQCHVLFSPWAHDLGNPAKLELCLRLGGYDAMIEAEVSESKERAERMRKDAEREREAAQRIRELCERTLQGASRASCLRGDARMIDLAQKLEEERSRVAAEAEERARTIAAHSAAEAARLAARTPEQIEADRKAEERQLQEARAEQERRARATAAAIPRMKEVAMDVVRNLHKDPDSVKFGDIRVVTDRSGGRILAICGTVSGTNSFGARVSAPWLFSTESDHAYIKGPEGWPGSGLSLWSQHCS